MAAVLSFLVKGVIHVTVEVIFYAVRYAREHVDGRSRTLKNVQYLRR